MVKWLKLYNCLHALDWNHHENAFVNPSSARRLLPKLKQSLTIDIENYCALIFGEEKEIEGNTRKLHLGNFTCKTKKIRIGHAY